MASVVVNGDTSGAVTLTAPAVAGTVTVTLPSTSGTMLTTASTTGISGSAISSGTVPEAYGGTGTSTGYYGFKNRIINGAMVIDQRNAGASVTPASGADTFPVDRFSIYSTQASKTTAQQNQGGVTPPVGFTNYLGVTSSSAYSVVASDLFGLFQNVEGYNVADLAWGTANAKTVTLSFSVYSSLTGTFGGAIANSSQDRSYPFSYTVSSANTWTPISITIPGDTTGTWLKTNGRGLTICWSLGMGSTRSGTANVWSSTLYFSTTGAVSVVGTSGATFYITGVQLEKGSTATSFDYRPYGTELALCQRYCVRYGGSYNYERIGFVIASSATGMQAIFSLPVEMRTQPTLSYSSASNWAYGDTNTGANTSGTSLTLASSGSSSKVVTIEIAGASGLTTYRMGSFNANGTTSASLILSAEL